MNGAPTAADVAGDFNPTAFLWLLSQQQHHQSVLNLSGRGHGNHAGSAHHPLPNGLTRGPSPHSVAAAGEHAPPPTAAAAAQSHTKNGKREAVAATEESTDDEEDEAESRSSHSDEQQNPVSSSGFNGESGPITRWTRRNRFRLRQVCASRRAAAAITCSMCRTPTPRLRTHLCPRPRSRRPQRPSSSRSSTASRRCCATLRVSWPSLP